MVFVPSRGVVVIVAAAVTREPPDYVPVCFSSFVAVKPSASITARIRPHVDRDRLDAVDLHQLKPFELGKPRKPRRPFRAGRGGPSDKEQQPTA